MGKNLEDDDNDSGIDETESVTVPLSPEQLLIVAIIDRALKDLNAPPKHIRMKALRWLRSRRYEPFSFLWCCHALGIEKVEIQSVINSAPKKKFTYKY